MDGWNKGGGTKYEWTKGKRLKRVKGRKEHSRNREGSKEGIKDQ